MKLLVVDNANPEDADFNRPLIDLLTASDVDLTVVNHQVLPSYRAIRKSYDAVILSGVPLHYSFQSIETRADIFSWITRTRMPVLGICLGHQVIGELFGGQIVPQLEEEIGLKSTEIIENSALFQHIDSSFESFMLHRAAVTVPKSFRVIAETELCENAVMKHASRPIYGMQFHPEHSPCGAQLIENFIASIEAKSTTEVLLSLDSDQSMQESFLAPAI